MKGKWSLEPKHPQSIISYCFVSGINHRAVAVWATDLHIQNAAQQVATTGAATLWRFSCFLLIFLCHLRTDILSKAQASTRWRTFTTGCSEKQIYKPCKHPQRHIFANSRHPPALLLQPNLTKFPTHHVSLILMSSLPWNSIRPEAEITSKCKLGSMFLIFLALLGPYCCLLLLRPPAVRPLASSWQLQLAHSSWPSELV